MNNNTDCFELYDCLIVKIIVENNADYIVGLGVNEEEYGLVLNSYEGTLLTFVDSGCAANSHIHIIHQILVKHMKSLKFHLDRIIIEAKYGDVVYCRAAWKNDQENTIYNIVSLGDALILHMLTQSELKISKFILDQLEKFDSKGYTESFED